MAGKRAIEEEARPESMGGFRKEKKRKSQQEQHIANRTRTFGR